MIGTLICVVFTHESSYCFQRNLAIAILSICLSVTQMDQAKAVQTLVSGTVKLFHKFKGGHPERGR